MRFVIMKLTVDTYEPFVRAILFEADKTESFVGVEWTGEVDELR